MELLVPSTYAINERDERLKVQRIGNLARAAATFGVDTITIYRDEDPKADEERNAEIMEKYLQYAETPPYLRKSLIPHDPDLQYANILPPLQIMSHGYSERFREGAIIDSGNGTLTVEVGLDEPVAVQIPEGTVVEEGARVTTMQTENGWELIEPHDIDGFWTFDIRNDRRDLGAVFEETTVPVIGTSAKGDPLSTYRDSDYVHSDIALVFGSAWRGIYELIERGDCRAEQFDGMYNFIPNQHTKTVRTGEAVPVVLGIVNAFHHTSGDQ